MDEPFPEPPGSKHGHSSLSLSRVATHPHIDCVEGHVMEDVAGPGAKVVGEGLAGGDREGREGERNSKVYV